MAEEQLAGELQIGYASGVLAQDVVLVVHLCEGQRLNARRRFREREDGHSGFIIDRHQGDGDDDDRDSSAGTLRLGSAVYQREDPANDEEYAGTLRGPERETLDRYYTEVRRSAEDEQREGWSHFRVAGIPVYVRDPPDALEQVREGDTTTPESSPLFKCFRLRADANLEDFAAALYVTNSANYDGDRGAKLCPAMGETWTLLFNDDYGEHDEEELVVAELAELPWEPVEGVWRLRDLGSMEELEERVSDLGKNVLELWEQQYLGWLREATLLRARNTAGDAITANLCLRDYLTNVAARLPHTRPADYWARDNPWARKGQGILSQLRSWVPFAEPLMQISNIMQHTEAPGAVITYAGDPLEAGGIAAEEVQPPC